MLILLIGFSIQRMIAIVIKQNFQRTVEMKSRQMPDKLLDQNTSYLTYIKQQQPQIWKELTKAKEEGLIYIDEVNDAISASNRLILTYPGLHDILNTLNDIWISSHAEIIGQMALNQLQNQPV